MKNIKIVSLIILVCLSGCSKTNEKTNINELIAEKKATGFSIAENIPKLKDYENFSYEAFEKKSPFKKYLDETIVKRRGDSVKPDFDRKKEHLESFDLSELSLTGIIENKGKRSAVIYNGKSNYIISVGNYLGKNFGKVKSIGDRSLMIAEIVKEDGINNWVKKDVELKMISQYEELSLD